MSGCDSVGHSDRYFVTLSLLSKSTFSPAGEAGGENQQKAVVFIKFWIPTQNISY